MARLRRVAAALLVLGATRVECQTLSRIINPPVGTSVEVSPGQQFYGDTYSKSVMGYRLDRPFKSSMAGSMGFPFAFEIGSDELLPAGDSQNGQWTYYLPRDGKFAASHGLLGSVIRDGDMVGLRVSKTGEKEWFVDNSKYNGFTTIWSRKVKAKDPAMRPFETKIRESAGLPVDRLIYLGIDGGRVKIRHEQIDPSGTTVRDEFFFPIDSNGIGVGAVKGAEFRVEADPVHAKITVTKAMNGDFARPQ